MPVKLLIPGRPEATPSAASRGGSPLTGGGTVTNLLDDVETVEAVSLSPSARAAAAATPVTMWAEDDDVLEIEVDGFKLWTSASKYAETVRIFRPEAAREDAAIVVDAVPNPDASRGDGRLASAVRVLRFAKTRFDEQVLDPRIRQEFSQDFGLEIVERGGSWVLAKAITWLIERQLRPREGLYTWAQATHPPAPGGSDPSPVTFDGFDTSQPILLFLHGTASSTLGSFGGFLEGDAADQWKELTGLFKNRIYALEHRTLSRSPIENAIAVAERLPAGARLYVVSHSRGGMIGDLLCLPRIDQGQIDAFGRPGAFSDADAYDRQKLQQLNGILAAKQFRVHRFARAACPARGTLLASENIDQFLSMIAYLLGLIPILKGSPIYEVVKRIALETVHRRWEPGMLPGLEAMTPESPLVQLLNETTDEASGSLGVIAGDIQGGNWLKRFGVFISDRMLYDSRDNDLVVNTDSMFLGASRKTARYVFDQGSDVSHFNYFRNRRTRLRVSQWMTARDETSLTDFRELEEAKLEPKPLPRAARNRAGTPRPAVVVVPDALASELYEDSLRVWLNRDVLAQGGLTQLADDGHQTRLRPGSDVPQPYLALCEFLSGTHDVIWFGYDWRRSTATSASALSTALGELLDKRTQPVRILAHGAGGLLVRQLMATSSDRDGAWARFREREGGRVVLLGTPHQGSYDAIELLLGTHPIAQQLALLDRRRGRGGVMAILQAFPGILELLPRNGTSNFFEAATWRTFSHQRGAPLPDAALLANARAVCDAADAQRLEPARVFNVVGSAARTVSGVELREHQVTLEITTEGDGRVTHDSARLPGLVSWQADASHGELISAERVFSPILELLQSGETRQLPTTARSATHPGEPRRSTLPERVLYPTASDLVASVFGRAPKVAYRADEPAGFRVSVVHGDLTFARYPIIVGHYEGDTIIGPEAVVDRLFDGALATRYNLGLYPGPLGTFAVVFREPTPLQRALQLPAGAIVVGLGRWGELTAAQIANIVRRGALEYVLQLDNQSPAAFRSTGTPAGSRDIGLSVLLIGATASNIATQDSVAAILRGIAQANLELASIGGGRARIGSIEIVELYVDTAIEATRAARQLAGALSDELKIRIEAEPFLQRGRQGRVRYAANRNADAWRRWEITAETADENRPRLPDRLREWLEDFARRDHVDPALLGALAGMALSDPQEPPRDRLRFVSLSDRARAEVTMEQHQPMLIERLVRSSIGDTRFNADAARALFELMVPNDLKDGLGQLSNVVFVLDGHTSAFPWELMTDGGEQPLCTRVNMVRQLQSATFRPHIRTTTAATAYVVGDPRVTPPFKQLPGARAEAEAVADKLKGRFEPTLLPAEATALDVLGNLFARPYRILHLAGHGHYEPGGTARRGELSGLVLDHGAFLTAAEVRKMAQVPELVFLNCCSIGQVGPEPIAPTRDVAYNRLAASISRELIEMGVRAVVAAGWAVRDDAALVFAQAFYDELLRGETFGRALKSARRSTWGQFRDTNTWGAYHAYGDPDFRLIQQWRTPAPSERVAPEELLEQIDKIWRRARIIDRERDLAVSDRDEDRTEAARIEQVSNLRELLARVPDAWLKRSDVLVAIGEAFGELAEYAEAINRLDEALDTGELDSKTTIKAAEQLLNFSARRAESEHNEGELRRAIARLEALQQVGPTSERYSLLGSAYKRLANVLEDAAATREAIEAAANKYYQAYQRDVARGTFNHYPVVNWLALMVVLDRAPEELGSLLKQSQLNAEERFISDRSAKDAVFSAVAAADIAVVRALADGTFSRDNEERTKEMARIVSLFEEAFRRVQATSRQNQSATGQLASLERFLEKLAGGAPTQENLLTRRALKAIRERL